MQKQRSNKGKKKMIDTSVKITRTYSTKGAERKFMGDTMRANKSATVKRRRLKKRTVIEKEENVEVVDVEESDEKIDPDVAATIKERRKEV